jgi:hypothetical protein
MSVTCICGYTSAKANTVRRHQKVCKKHLVHEALKTSESGNTQQEKHIAALEARLEEKDARINAMESQIKELIQMAKRPRTVNNTNNNRYVVEQHINVFGQESLEHITPEQIQMLLADPESAVARLVKLKHRKEPRNANVRCPNVNRAIYQVVVREGEEKEWENRAKGEVLEKLYDDNSCMLEAEADEEEHTSFLSHRDKVKASAAANSADGGRCYKEQLDKIHHMIVQ